MEIRRFNNQSSRESSKQKKMTVVESRRKPVGAPDLTDFMNDMFFGTVKSSDDQKKAYNLTGTDQAVGVKDRDKDEHLDEDSSRRSTSSRLTEEWLDEARRLVASSPSRCDSPSRLVGSPRFAAAAQGTPFSASFLDRRDPLSRSARR
ncbi:hypothetical protein TIFTF001_049764 [Ficus carica]|uniref:Uncharacterized protein n=1 Tax=Ficus carica TaxID=3494 RepID=A0AA88CWA0_FICCA|nr:hypothetical protein TIFTF001_049764 [Ficus carica]